MFQILHKKGDSGWCPLRNQHMVYSHLTRLDSPSKDMNCLYDESVREKLLYRMKRDIILDGKRIGLK